MVSRVGAVSDDFRKLALGYGLTTAEILYRMPDHPSLLPEGEEVLQRRKFRKQIVVLPDVGL